MEGLIFVLRKTSLTTLTEMWTERKTLHVEDCEAAGFRPAFSKKKLWNFVKCVVQLFCRTPTDIDLSNSLYIVEKNEIF